MAQLPACTTATATQDPNRLGDLLHGSRQCRILTHSTRPGTKPASSWIPVRFVTRRATMGTPVCGFSVATQTTRKSWAAFVVPHRKQFNADGALAQVIVILKKTKSRLHPPVYFCFMVLASRGNMKQRFCIHAEDEFLGLLYSRREFWQKDVASGAASRPRARAATHEVGLATHIHLFSASV